MTWGVISHRRGPELPRVSSNSLHAWHAAHAGGLPAAQPAQGAPAAAPAPAPPLLAPAGTPPPSPPQPSPLPPSAWPPAVAPPPPAAGLPTPSPRHSAPPAYGLLQTPTSRPPPVTRPPPSQLPPAASPPPPSPPPPPPLAYGLPPPPLRSALPAMLRPPPLAAAASPPSPPPPVAAGPPLPSTPMIVQDAFVGRQRRSAPAPASWPPAPAPAPAAGPCGGGAEPQRWRCGPADSPVELTASAHAELFAHQACAEVAPGAWACGGLLVGADARNALAGGPCWAVCAPPQSVASCTAAAPAGAPGALGFFPGISRW